ncbi:MAG: flagellar biosynthesis anti-sigma factor FlgM [Treponema sp.]|nr:flagellar biosynthesis anti-sigma factor FlgM [Treponema sp.]
MMINRIGPIDPIQSGKNAGWISQVNRTVQTDSISLSAEAREKSEVYQANAVVASVSDVRMDRIAELKQKINDPSYINDKIIKATADKIMDAFGL